MVSNVNAYKMCKRVQTKCVFVSFSAGMGAEERHINHFTPHFLFLSFPVFFFPLKKLCIYLFKTVHAVQARRGGHKHSIHMNQKHVAGFSILSVPQHKTFLKLFYY